MRFRGTLLILSCLAPTGPAAAPAAAWAPESRVAIADWAAQIAPPDLRRQIERRASAFRDGVLAPLEPAADGNPQGGPDGDRGRIERIVREAERAIALIEEHRPFDDVVYQLGIVCQLVAAAANPLEASDGDPQEGRYHDDFLRYALSAEKRLEPVFYGIPARSDTEGLRALIAATLERSRALYPSVGREYRRIGFADGRRRFDDRSTAFGVVSVAYSQAISDAAVALRYIWLRAGGADARSGLPVRGR
ncbi:MAG: hypothetical protein ACRD2Z_17020 [Thermoanaerobaculia bacterium]